MNMLWKPIIIFFAYFFLFILLPYFYLRKRLILIVSLIFALFLFVIFVIYYIYKSIIKKENNIVLNASLKIKKLNELNDNYHFKKISCKKHKINEREYSRKSLDRVTPSSIINYHFDNDISLFRTDIENALYNISLLDKYSNDVSEIMLIESDNTTKYPLKKFKRIENRVFNNLVHKKDDFLITLFLYVYYSSNSGNINDSWHLKYSFDELTIKYNEWKSRNVFKETAKQERKIMNDDIRYNVLKRDNFKCQICGVSSKDGATLHVDHIIPVSKGGKTVMSNLQTLCDRCNIGKSNKTDEICPKCGGILKIRNGKYGSFIGCSNYPNCNYKNNIK